MFRDNPERIQEDVSTGESLVQEVTTIELPNLPKIEVEKFTNIQALFSTLLNDNLANVAVIFEPIAEFLAYLKEELLDDEDRLKNCAAYHLLAGDEIPDTVKEADFDGKYSIEAFLKTLQ